MTATVEVMSPPRKKKATEPAPLELEAAREMVRAAKAQGLSLTGPDGLLKQLTKTVVEVSLEEEMTEHLGYAKHDAAGRESGNIRNGTRTKTVLTDNAGPVEIEVPRDRDGTFEPVIVAKHQRRLNGVDEIVLSLTAKGLTTGEITAHFAEIYGASVSKETISPDHRQGDRGDDRLAEPAARPGVRGDLHRRGARQDPRRAGRQPADLRRDRGHPDGGKDILGLWAGTGGRGREVLDGGAHRHQEPGRDRHVLRRLRRAEGTARRGRQRVARRRSCRPASST